MAGDQQQQQPYKKNLWSYSIWIIIVIILTFIGICIYAWFQHRRGLANSSSSSSNGGGRSNVGSIRHVGGRRGGRGHRHRTATTISFAEKGNIDHQVLTLNDLNAIIPIIALDSQNIRKLTMPQYHNRNSIPKDKNNTLSEKYVKDNACLQRAREQARNSVKTPTLSIFSTSSYYCLYSRTTPTQRPSNTNNKRSRPASWVGTSNSSDSSNNVGPTSALGRFTRKLSNLSISTAFNRTSISSELSTATTVKKPLPPIPLTTHPLGLSKYCQPQLQQLDDTLIDVAVSAPAYQQSLSLSLPHNTSSSSPTNLTADNDSSIRSSSNTIHRKSAACYYNPTRDPAMSTIPESHSVISIPSSVITKSSSTIITASNSATVIALPKTSNNITTTTTNSHHRPRPKSCGPLLFINVPPSQAYILSSTLYDAPAKSTPTLSSSSNCCAICIDTFRLTQEVRVLPCSHLFHRKCIDPWLLHPENTCYMCPLCKQSCIPSLSDKNIITTDLTSCE